MIFRPSSELPESIPDYVVQSPTPLGKRPVPDRKDNMDHRFRVLYEQLANIEHQRWSDWQRYVHSRCITDDLGNLVIPRVMSERWQRQIDTPYQNLTEHEKQSDRDQVDRYWPLVEDYVRRYQRRCSPNPHLVVVLLFLILVAVIFIS